MKNNAHYNNFLLLVRVRHEDPKGGGRKTFLFLFIKCFEEDRKGRGYGLFASRLTRRKCSVFALVILSTFNSVHTNNIMS